MAAEAMRLRSASSSAATMHADQWRKMRRLLVWFLLNALIFIASYLNYLLQPKHRYLYKTLSVSRASRSFDVQIWTPNFDS